MLIFIYSPLGRCLTSRQVLRPDQFHPQTFRLIFTELVPMGSLRLT